MTSIRSSLAHMVTGRRDPETVKRDGWHETGILAVDVKDARLDFAEREFLTQIGNRLYGEAGDLPTSNIRRLRR